MVVTALGGALGAEIYGSTITPVAAKFTRASSEYLSIVDNAALSFGANVDATFAGWVYFDSFVDFQTVFGKDNAAGTVYEYRLLVGAAGQPVFQVSPDGTGAAVASASWAQVLALDTWYFIVCQYDQAQITISVNRGTPAVAVYTGDIFNGTNGFTLGGDHEGALHYVNGKLDAWGVWKRVLTAVELNFLYNSGHARVYSDLDTAMKTSMVAWWGLDETSGSRADSHGANTLTDNNTVTSATGVDVISFIAYLPTIFSPSIEGKINSVGSLSLAVPLSSATRSAASISREIRLFKEGDGEIWRGYIYQTQESVLESGERRLELRCVSMAMELVWLHLVRGLVLGYYTLASVSSALDRILSGSGWSGTVTGSGYETLTKSWDIVPKLSAALDLAKIANAYIRETTTARVLELKNVSSDSGIILKNVGHLGPELIDNPTYGIVSAVRSLSKKGERIANRIAPYGKIDGDVLFDLSYSDRSSPYEIKSEVGGPPVIVDQVVFFESASGPPNINAFPVGDNFLHCLGRSRAVIAFFSCASTSGTGLPSRITVGGKEMVQFFSGTGSSRRIMAWYLQAPPVGLQTLSAIYAVTGPPADARWQLLALDNVLQNGTPIRDTSNATGTSTTPSVAVDSLPDDLTLDRLIHASATVSSVGANQTETPNVSTTGGGNQYDGRTSFEEATGASVTMEWTLSGSVAWFTFGCSIMPQPTYYIEDTASQATYGRRDFELPLGTYRVLTSGQMTDAANTMYDRAVDEILENKAPPDSYELDVLSLPDVAWLPGDSMYVDVVDPESGMVIDEDLIVTQYTRREGDAGETSWTLTLSTVAELQDEFGPLFRLVERMNEVQAGQV